MLKKMQKNLSNDRGFTLIELMVVLVILGILASIAIPRFNSKVIEAQEIKTQADIKIIQNAVDIYHLKYDLYPASTSKLVEAGYLHNDPVQVDGTSPYIINAITGLVSTE